MALPRDELIIEEDLAYDEYDDLVAESFSSNCTDSGAVTTNSYMCDMCGEIFVDENALTEHKKLNHQDEELGESGVTDEEHILNADDLVDSTVSESGNLITSAGQKYVPNMCRNLNGEFECTICHKSFLSKSALDVHLVKCHTKRYTCERCGKMFPYRYQLTTHINGVHLSIRNHTCEMCGKSFKTRANFDSHLARHRDIRNYPCPYCEHRSRSNHDLTVHLRKHTGEKPYTCEICGREFAHSINRIKHQRSIHGLSQIETDKLRTQNDQLIFEGEQSDQVEYRKIVHGKLQIVELDALQFPDNELAGD